MVEPPGDGDRPRRPPFDAAPTGGYREVSPTALGVSPFWFTTNDCIIDPSNCTIRGNASDRDFECAPICTTGTTPRRDGRNYGASVVLGCYQIVNAYAAGV